MKIETGINLNSYIEIQESVVKVRAYYYWENAGRPDNRSEEFYYQALNDIFDETKEKVVQAANDEEKECFELAVACEDDSLWYQDIEELLPEIRTMKFKNAAHKISWMFNNLKKLKNRIEPATGPVCTKPINLEETMQIVIEQPAAPTPDPDGPVSPQIPVSPPREQPVVEPVPYVNTVGDNPEVPAIAVAGDLQLPETITIQADGGGHSVEMPVGPVDGGLHPDIGGAPSEVMGGLTLGEPIAENRQKQELPPTQLSAERFKELYKEDKLVFAGQVS